ncbi:GNAT family N-acetyltransferase [Vulcaniibacterium gelatinicum]|uniref:GNAT family N-acetyltransferase n=1 Tax=Vulcaniibacterium gelatinicum TaxID=2598725 RepID=UPI0015F2B95B|nr:GNAT family N-acetyltransferase [Vulcaniibacterium gelatinicum]
MIPFDTARLHLRPLAADDAALYVALYTDPAVMAHVAAPMTGEAARRSFEKACARNRESPPRWQRWAIRARGSGEAVGLCGLFRDADREDSAEIGVMLLPAWQGRGVAAEVIAAFAARAFDPAAPWPLARLWARHAAGNTPMGRVLARLGFRPIPSDIDDERCWELSRPG